MATSQKSDRNGWNLERGMTGTIAASALAGLAVGLAATMGRRYAMQAAGFAGKDWDEALKADHRAVEAIFDKLRMTESKQSMRRKLLVMQLKKALTRHALEEENAVYPALAETLGNGTADSLFTEHAEMKKALHALGDCDPAGGEFMRKVEALQAIVSGHVAEEETLLDELKANLTSDQNAALNAAAFREGVGLS